MQHKPTYTVESEVAMICGALTVAMRETASAKCRVLIKDARQRSYRLWKRLAAEHHHTPQCYGGYGRNRHLVCGYSSSNREARRG